jgi:ubiquinone/menaquinone biosynthesis C-methylase UbiE
LISKDKNFTRKYIKVWDQGAIKDAPFITMGMEALLQDFYGDLFNAPPPFPVKQGEKVLDLGCGWGRVLKPVLDRDVFGVGMDISENMLELSKKHLNSNGYTPILLRGDGTMLPIKDNSFDTVYSLLVLQHLSKENGKDVLKEIRRVLKPNGVAYIRVPGRFAPENLLFSFLQFISIHIFRLNDPIRMRFYKIGEINKICEMLFKEFEVTAHEFRPPWNFHTKWTWHYIIIPRMFHKPLKKISDKLEHIANTKLGFLKHFGVVLMIRVNN